MTTAYLANPVQFQQPISTHVRALANRLGSWLAERRATRALRHEQNAWRYLSKEALADAGVDLQPYDTTPSLLARSNPYVFVYSDFSKINLLGNKA